MVAQTSTSVYTQAMNVETHKTPRSLFFAGARAQIPMILGAAPFGMIYGVLARSAGLPPELAQAMSSVVFAGSSQFIATNLFATAAPFVVIVLTTFVVNLRHALYSASIAPHVEHLPARWKVLLSYLLTDEAYAVTIAYYRTSAPTPSPSPVVSRGVQLNAPTDRGGVGANDHYYFLGAGLALWVNWQIATAAGIFFGARVPESWSLDFALPLMFIALVVTALRDRPSMAAAAAAAVIAVIAYGLPYKLGLMLAALAGILAGLILEQFKIGLRQT